MCLMEKKNRLALLLDRPGNLDAWESYENRLEKVDAPLIDDTDRFRHRGPIDNIRTALTRGTMNDDRTRVWIQRILTMKDGDDDDEFSWMTRAGLLENMKMNPYIALDLDIKDEAGAVTTLGRASMVQNAVNEIPQEDRDMIFFEDPWSSSFWFEFRLLLQYLCAAGKYSKAFERIHLAACLPSHISQASIGLSKVLGFRVAEIYKLLRDLVEFEGHRELICSLKSCHLR